MDHTLLVDASELARGDRKILHPFVQWVLVEGLLRRQGIPGELHRDGDGIAAHGDEVDPDANILETLGEDDLARDAFDLPRLELVVLVVLRAHDLQRQLLRVHGKRVPGVFPQRCDVNGPEAPSRDLVGDLVVIWDVVVRDRRQALVGEHVAQPYDVLLRQVHVLRRGQRHRGPASDPRRGRARPSAGHSPHCGHRGAAHRASQRRGPRQAFAHREPRRCR
mmetsp:Transcript_25098/g.71663  ORF Transcript_25098/g.71663 Transcript_25098/m.71663 type:complete len:221 (-) Transcript_25098:79-741(-)